MKPKSMSKTSISLFDLLGDLSAPFLQLRRSGHEDRIAQRHIFRDVQELDLAILDPRLHREFPTVKMGFQQRRELLVGNGCHVVGGADHPMSQAASLVEGLEMDRVVGVAIELEQRLIYPLEKADDIGMIHRFLENADANAAKLCATLHQRLVAKQHRLSQQSRVVEKNRVYRASPFDGFLEQRNRDIDTHLLERESKFVGAVVETLEIPTDEGDVVC
jgi:hypothetical protein